jgi:hypothetical protein
MPCGQSELVIASGGEAIHGTARDAGLLRRFAPLRKRFAFVAGNDGLNRKSRHR